MAISYRNLYGQECRAGWGYDAENGAFIKNFELTGKDIFTRPIFVKTKEFNMNAFNFFTFIPSYPDTNFIESLVGKNENSYKFMDFILQNWNTNGHISEITAVTKITYIDTPVSCPSEATHYIKTIYYGLQMFVIFDKSNNHLFENENDDGQFLNKIWRQQTSLSDEQKNVVCSVLIFSSNHEKTIIKEMAMQEIRELLMKVRNKKYAHFVSSVQCILEPMPNYEFPVISEIAIKTMEIGLFSLYRKRKLMDKELDLLESSSNAFNEKKKQLELLKSKFEKLWDLRIGQCSKLLQGSKLTDFELCFGSPLDELVEMENEQQNKSSAEEIGLKFYSRMNDQIVMMGKDYFCSLDPEMVKKLKMGVFLSNEEGEPFISNKNLDTKIFIGFASHQDKFTNDEVETSEMFVTSCPEKCTRDERQWICVTCGNFFKAKNFEVVCDCGTTHVTNLKLECFDPKHPKTIFPSSLKSCSTCGISTPRTSSTFETRMSSFPTFE
uniref:Uncharacterized protein n=1 Tax=Panagrolaimus sp. JU765 TaxID=591449 RepID=A0AC34RTC4_9BILA